LILAGISEVILNQLDKSGALNIIGRENTFIAEAQWGQAAQRAYSAAYAWLGDAAPPALSWSLVTGRAPIDSTPIDNTPIDSALSPQPTTDAPTRAIHIEESEESLVYLEELERLYELEKKGVLTAEEFSEKKRRILGLQ
jgi:hypothetical protein